MKQSLSSPRRHAWLALAVTGICATLFAKSPSQDAAHSPRPVVVQEVAPSAPVPEKVEPAELVPLPSAWQGTMSAQGATIFVHIAVAGTLEAPTAEITVPQAGAFRSKGADLKIDGGSCEVTLTAGGVSGTFRGVVSKDLTRYVGSLTLLSDPATPPSETPFSLVRTYDASQAPNREVWEGTLELMGQKIPMAFTLADLGDKGMVGCMDVPIQGLERFPLVVTKGADGAITIVAAVGRDVTIKVKPEGEGKLAGTFEQAGFTAPYTLTKATDQKGSLTRRPQEPKPPFPYRAVDATIPTSMGHTLAGTLTMPERKEGSPSSFPAVVLVSGSGPQDRDEAIMGHRPFAVLADALTKAGVAVLRYDDRGVGSSTGTFARCTTADFARDADEAANWLKRQPEIDAARVGVLGHSEGGLVAPMVAKWQWERSAAEEPHPIAFVVLLAGPGVDGRAILEVQIRRILQANGLEQAVIDGICSAQSELLGAIVANAPEEVISEKAAILVESQIAVARAQGQPVPEGALEPMIKATAESLREPWMEFFLTYDPVPALASLRIPILAMNGTLDTQVDADQNLPAIEKAAKEGGAPLTVRRMEGLNHLFQAAKTGGPDEYALIETTIDPAALEALVEWVVKVGKEVPPLRPATPPSSPAPTGQ